MSLAGLDGSTSRLTTKLFISRKKTKVINSVIVIDFDEDERTKHVVNKWNGADLPTGFGKCQSSALVN